MKFYKMKIQNNPITSILSMALTGLWVLCGTTAQAQQAERNEVALTLGSVFSSLNYDIPQTDINYGLGINAGIAYTYMFSNNFGVTTGAEFQSFGAESKTESLSGAYETIDYEDESFEFRYLMTEIKEEQRMGFINIPLLLAYENKEYGFYVKAGAKVGFSVYNKFTTNYNLSTSGFYEQYNGELFDPQFMGFGEFGRVSGSNTDIDTKTNVMASIEFGLKQPIAGENLYVGLFFDYGLTNIKGNEQHPVEYALNNQGAYFKNHSVINSAQNDKLNILAFGIKVRYSIFTF